MRTRARIFAAVSLLLLLISACDLQGPAASTTPTAPTNAPTAAAVATAVAPTNAPTAAAVATAAAPTSAPTAAAAATPAPDVEIGAVEPITATIPDSFKAAADGTFANFNMPKVQDAGQVQAPEIAPDLSNVALSVILSPEQRELVAKNGFAVSPGTTKEFYEVYERARYDYVPVFVSSDSLLHVYHLLFDKALRRAETESFIPMLARLDWELLNTSLAQYEELKGTPWNDAARRNAAYFAVAVKLLDPDWPIPQGLRDLAEPDLASIAAHQGLGESAIFPAYPFGEDWSQYVPRGHYTKSEALKRYFTAMMWHGRMTFRVKDATETRQAALLTLAFRQTKVDNQPAQAVWSGIYDPTVFFVGRSDDLTPQEYDTALDSAYGQVDDAQALVDEAKFARFQQLAQGLRAPEILGMIISEKEPDVDAATKGLRFMGQRFVPDAFVFRQLIHRNVDKRMLPKALDFFAALGSDRALGHLETSGDTAMPNYTQNMEKLRGIVAGYSDDVWTQNLYWSWIHGLRPLLEPPGEGYPQFMRSEAWLDKQLNTALGSWTELKRDTILYAKQVYAEMGAGALPPPTPEPPKGYVEPVPLVYARILALTQMTIEGLDRRGLLPADDKQALEAMARVAGQLQTIAEKELRNEAPTEDEYTFIRFYGGEIEKLTFAADDAGVYPGAEAPAPMGGEDLQAAVVADVATDPNGQVLEEGVGRIFEIYAVAPIEGKLVLTKGGVFSHYEFAQPISDRLTDEAWRAMLDEGKAPPLADWTSSFIVDQNAALPLADTIRRFNDGLVKAIWFSEIDQVGQYLADPELSDTRNFIDQLKAQKQFIGMKLLGMEFLSFDFQDDSHATVTTREHWIDEQYSGTPLLSDQGQEQAQKIGVRGPYETTVTYTMQRQGEGWVITKIVTQPEPPVWQQP
ncbi:MAG: DUF3160 domain-containing protein [Roseiflexaceae bacterium]